MTEIKNWKAKRAGGRITVYGELESGTTFKVAGVDFIQREDGQVVATDKTGAKWKLV